MEKLCDMSRERNITVLCFFVDFAAQKEQSPFPSEADELEKISGEISQTYQEHKGMLGWRGL